MIIPQSNTEKLLFNTVRLKTSVGVGTGFFFNFNFGDKIAPAIITNKHVVNYKHNEKVNFSLHIGIDKKPTDQNMNLDFNTGWFFHPSLDLCFCFVNPLFEEVKNKFQKSIFYIPITEDLIWDDEKLKDLQAVEDVLMIGSPIGLQDEKNNLPLIRKGITSSHPAIDFNKSSVGVVDLSVFPGSSGSPLFIFNNSGYSDKKGNHHIGSSRIIFLGILFGGPTLQQSGEISIQEIPTQKKVITKTPLMINLGYYIKSKEVFLLKEIAEKIINKKQ